jgi:hypothetical protein
LAGLLALAFLGSLLAPLTCPAFRRLWLAVLLWSALRRFASLFGPGLFRGFRFTVLTSCFGRFAFLFGLHLFRGFRFTGLLRSSFGRFAFLFGLHLFRGFRFTGLFRSSLLDGLALLARLLLFRGLRLRQFGRHLEHRLFLSPRTLTTMG